VVWLGGSEVIRATLSGGLYYVDRAGGGEAAYSTISSGSLRLWHQRLGHLHLDAVRELP